jgi:hypothetical protein
MSEDKAANLSELGEAIERAIITMMQPNKWSALKFHEQMHLLDKALKLEAIKQKAAEPGEGSWFRNNFEDQSDEEPIDGSE